MKSKEYNSKIQTRYNPTTPAKVEKEKETLTNRRVTEYLTLSKQKVGVMKKIEQGKNLGKLSRANPI